jgi:ATP-dependent Clp protease protease subunit
MATAASSSSLTAPLLRPNPNPNPAPRSLPLLRFPSPSPLLPTSLPALTRLHPRLAGTGGALAAWRPPSPGARGRTGLPSGAGFGRSGGNCHELCVLCSECVLLVPWGFWCFLCPCRRDDLVVPRSPYFPVEYAAGQERGPSPMVMERFQSVVSQLFQHVREYCILCKCLDSTRRVFF